MIIQTLASELSVQPQQIQAAVSLLDEGATVPFIARYRKEATNGLDDAQLRLLENRLGYLRELAERKHTILKRSANRTNLHPLRKSTAETTTLKTILQTQASHQGSNRH